MFVDSDGNVQVSQLRESIFSELTRLETRFEYLLETNKSKKTLHDLHVSILEFTTEDKTRYLRGYSQIVGITVFIHTWIQTSVETKERMSFFVESKASELKTGDAQKDYYWALCIRHDQLIALTSVVSALERHLTRWIDMTIEAILEDDTFLGLCDISLEEQIYLEAEKVRERREAQAS